MSAASVVAEFHEVIERFGVNVATNVEELNDVCRTFFKLVNRHVFDNDLECRRALSAFKETVEATLIPKSQKRAVYKQVESILLNPSKAVTGRNLFSQNLRLMLTQDSCDAKCSECQGSIGFIVRCGGQRCNKLVHVGCAASKHESKRYSAWFYHCSSCSSCLPSEISDDEGQNGRKRGSTGGAGKGRKIPNQNDTAASGNPSSHASDVPTSSLERKGSASTASSRTFHLSPDREYRNHSMNSNSPRRFESPYSDLSHVLTPAFVNDSLVVESGYFESSYVSPRPFVNDLSSSSTRPFVNNLSSSTCTSARRQTATDAPDLAEACEQFVFLKNDLEAVRSSLQATHEYVGSNVSHENAVQVRKILGEIRSGIGLLNNWAIQFQTAHEKPLVTNDSSEEWLSFGGSVVVSNDVLSDALHDISIFENFFTTLHREFEPRCDPPAPHAPLSTVAAVVTSPPVIFANLPQAQPAMSSTPSVDDIRACSPSPQARAFPAAPDAAKASEAAGDGSCIPSPRKPPTAPGVAAARTAAAASPSAPPRRVPLKSSGWLNDMNIADCLGMFAVLRQDVLFIHPHHCDSIALCPHQPSNWSSVFQRFVSSRKFNHVVALVDVDGFLMDIKSRADNQGTHWVASVGDVTTQRAWIYDPAGTQGVTSQGLSILSAVTSHLTKREFKFTQVTCPFQFRCQFPPDGQHCGVWSLMIVLNWCTNTLSEYEAHMRLNHGTSSKNLMAFGSECRNHLIADLDKGVVDSSMLFWNPPVFSGHKSSFWTLTSQMNVAFFLNQKFSCTFQEMSHYKGQWKQVSDTGYTSYNGAQEGNPWEAVQFYVSSSVVVKVYRILLGWKSSSATGYLAQALHEASATAYVCSKKQWKFDVFGVVTQGARASYLHICILRSRLDDVLLNEIEASIAFVDLVRTVCVVHGDAHVGNAKRRLGCADIEVIDLERSFLLGTNDAASIISSSENYTRNSEARPYLVNKMKCQGLDSTRKRFIKMCSDQLSILHKGLDDFLGCFSSP